MNASIIKYFDQHCQRVNTDFKTYRPQYNLDIPLCPCVNPRSGKLLNLDKINCCDNGHTIMINFLLSVLWNQPLNISFRIIKEMYSWCYMQRLTIFFINIRLERKLMKITFRSIEAIRLILFAPRIQHMVNRCFFHLNCIITL